jgi:hypothetical protein
LNKFFFSFLILSASLFYTIKRKNNMLHSKKGKQSIGWVVSLLWVCLLAASLGWAQEDSSGDWPREIDTPQGTVVIYQPQPEKLDGNQLKGRAAVAVELKESTEPVFGVVWFEARLETDRAERTAIIADVTVTQVRFPEQDEQKSKKLKALLEKEIPKWQLPISMDRLLTTLDLAEQRSEAAQKINTKPPKLLFVAEPAVLITLDGEPKLKKEEGSELMRVINTPFTILLVPSEKTYYLYADKDTWYTAIDIKGDWAVSKKVPKEVSERAPKAEPDTGEKEATEHEKEPGPPPKVIVVTEPAELISSKGEPEYTPISGTDLLLYMSNTDSDVLFHIKNQQYFILLSGRWYTSSKMEGPWQYVPGEKLPSDFAKIPEDAEMGTVLYSVPDTDVAKEAVLDTQIPQTAAVDRKKAKLTVEYDGDPKFENIKGTEMTYAVNTATPVIYANNKYYACDEAVWFIAGKATGPWQVATSVPDEIYTIPPESPIYHVTFVRIYHVTDDVVYVGYTPGYTNTYVYNTTIVYGTGYWYPGWYGSYYYPRPATWGFHVRYNPWTGWRFGFSYGWGPFRFTIGGGGWYRGGWWGPGRYRGYRRGYRHGYRHGRNAGYRAGRHNAAQQNLYRSQRNKVRTTKSPATAGKRAKASGMSHRANNVYADRNGDVHRKTDKGWEKRAKDGWKSEKDQPAKTQQQKTKPTQTQVQKSQQRQNQQLDRSYQARQQGEQRARSYNQAQGRSHSSRSSGRSRGGGGRGGGGRR